MLQQQIKRKREDQQVKQNLDASAERSKYTEKPVAAIAAEEKVSNRPAKDSVAPAGQYSFDDFPPLGDEGFPPIGGREECPPPAPVPEPHELPSPIEMSILPAEGEEKTGDKISHSKRRSSFTRHRSKERSRLEGSEKSDESKEKKEKSGEKISSSAKRRSKPKLRGSDERTGTGKQ